MTDILIRGLRPDIVGKIDGEAKRTGVSRNEFLVSYFTQRFGDQSAREVSAQDLARSSEAVADLLNPEVMAGAWR